MGNKLYNEESVQNIANAIRSVNGSTNTYKIGDMANAISSISTGLDWSDLNYNTSGPAKGTPSEIVNGFNYAKTIMENYTASSLYTNDLNLIFWPNINITGRFNYQNMFNGSALMHIDPVTLGEETPTGTITTNYMFMATLIEDIEISTVNNVTAGMAHTFKDCKRLKTIKINFTPNDIEGLCEGCSNLTTINTINTSGITNMRYIFKGCASLVSAPAFDTSNATLFNETFNGCTALTTIPIYNTSKITNFTSFVNNCPALTDTSLDNILVMCINATAYNGNKKLSQLGVGNIYDTRIQALPHYNDFIDAGWIIR